MMWWQIVALLGAAWAQPGVGPTADGPIFSVNDYVSDVDSDAGGWFVALELGQRLLVPEGGERETFWQLLGASVERRVALRLRFDANAARLSADGAMLEYPLCSISVRVAPRSVTRRAIARRRAGRARRGGLAGARRRPGPPISGSGSPHALGGVGGQPCAAGSGAVDRAQGSR